MGLTPPENSTPTLEQITSSVRFRAVRAYLPLKTRINDTQIVKAGLQEELAVHGDSREMIYSIVGHKN